MTIQGLIDGAVATDGGSISCSLELADGTVLECGLDARIPKTQSERVIFVGASYPTEPGVRLLARHSAEEQQFISALQDFVSRKPSDHLAGLFLQAVLHR